MYQCLCCCCCCLGNEYALRGSPLPLKKTEALKGAMHRRASPAIRACPMDLAGLKSFLAGPGLCDEEKTFLIIYWLSGQRPGDLINQKVCDIAMMENNHELQLSIWMYQMCKNTTTTERLSPRCVRMYVPAFWSDLVVKQIWRRREANEQQLFPGVKLHQIDQRLRKIPVVTRHPLLKEKHTLYSIRRGALQHLAAAGEDAVAIQQLTRHVSEASLRAYLGSFLDPRAIAGLEVSQKLGQYVAVPFEHPTTQTREIGHNQATTSRIEEKPDLDEPRTTLSAEKRGFTPAEETLLPLETIVETGSIQIQQESTPESLRKEVRPTNGPAQFYPSIKRWEWSLIVHVLKFSRGAAIYLPAGPSGHIIFSNYDVVFSNCMEGGVYSFVIFLLGCYFVTFKVLCPPTEPPAIWPRVPVGGNE